MTTDERLQHAVMIYEALAKQGMAAEAVPSDIKANLDAFVNDGCPCELDIKTPKGQIYTKLANFVPVATTADS